MSQRDDDQLQDLQPVSPSTDTVAFEILVREHHRMVLAYLRSILPKHAPVEDLAQECFLVVHRRLEEFDQERDFGRWVRGIARNKALEWMRRKHEQPLDAAALAQVEAAYASWFAPGDETRPDTLGALAQCLQRLGALLRKAVEAHYFQGLSLLAAAGFLGASEDAVKKRLQRAREDLATCIAERVGQEDRS